MERLPERSERFIPFQAELDSRWSGICTSDKFWNLEERIKKDKKHPGVMLELSKGNMMFDILALINGGVITTADLEGFSDELKESVNFLLHR